MADQDPKARADYDYWIAKGIDFLNDINTYGKALFAFNKAIRLDRKSATAWAFKAYVFFCRGRHCEAAPEVIRHASSFDPENPIVLFYNAHKLYFLEDQLLEPLALVEKALEKWPGLAPAWVLKADIFDRLNWLEESVAAFDRAIALGYKGSYVHGQKGKVLICLCRYQEAVVAFDAAIAQNLRHYDWWGSKAVALAKLGRYEEAVETYDKALERCHGDHLILYNKGVSLLRLGRYDEALQTFDKSIEKYPKYAQAWNNKSWIFRQMGRFEDAKKASARAVEIDPDMVEPDYCTARDAAMLGDKATALEYLRRLSKRVSNVDEKMNEDPAFKDFWEH